MMSDVPKLTASIASLHLIDDEDIERMSNLVWLACVCGRSLGSNRDGLSLADGHVFLCLHRFRHVLLALAGRSLPECVDHMCFSLL